MIFYGISELMLATLIQRYDKKSFHFKNERLIEILQAVRCHILWLFQYYIYQFIKSFVDDKISISEEYGEKMYYNICPQYWDTLRIKSHNSYCFKSVQAYYYINLYLFLHWITKLRKILPFFLKIMNKYSSIPPIWRKHQFKMIAYLLNITVIILIFSLSPHSWYYLM